MKVGQKSRGRRAGAASVCDPGLALPHVGTAARGTELINNELPIYVYFSCEVVGGEAIT